jgi:hypothetical protein
MQAKGHHQTMGGVICLKEEDLNLLTLYFILEDQVTNLQACTVIFVLFYNGQITSSVMILF